MADPSPTEHPRSVRGLIAGRLPAGIATDTPRIATDTPRIALPGTIRESSQRSYSATFPPAYSKPLWNPSEKTRRSVSSISHSMK